MEEGKILKKTVLVIEDDEINLQLLVRILEDTYSVIAARNGLEGLNMLRRYGSRISAVMLDIQMPVMNGYELLERVSSDAALCKIPVIVATALDSRQDEMQCLELGAVDFISKPYNAQLILLRLKNIIKLRESELRISELEIDALTGFKNRMAYYEDIAKIEADKEKKEQPLGIIFADINGLKLVNDDLGHEAGDQLISGIARSITEVFPDANKYRIGGDEFVILSYEENEEAFNEKLQLLGNSWQEGQSAAIGSVWLEEATQLEKQVAAADKAMYCAKSRHYESRMHDRRKSTQIMTADTLKRIEDIAEYLPGGFFIYRADGDEELISFNFELVKIFGCETEEEFRTLVHNSFRGIVHPDDLKLVESDISSQINHDKDIDCVRYRIICKDGTVKNALDYGRFVHTELYGDVYYVFLVTI